MGNSSSFRVTSPCECLHHHKIVPVSDHQPETIIIGNGHLTSSSNGNLHPIENVATAYINNASLGSTAFRKDDCPMCWLFLGLDGAGKTSVIHSILQKYPPKSWRGRRASQIADGDFWDPKPTLGFSKEDILYRKHSIVMHDLGGGGSIRAIWKNYFAEAHAVIFVVDGSLPSDSPRWEELNELLETCSKSDALRGKPVLFLLNKQDVQPNTDEAVFLTRIKVKEFSDRLSALFKIFPVCAHEKVAIKSFDARKLFCHKNIESAILWLVQKIEDSYPGLHARVQQDSKLQTELEEELRQERAARYKAAREARQAEEMAANQEEEEDMVDGFVPIEAHLERVGRRQSIPKVSAYTPQNSARSATIKGRSEPDLRSISFSGSSSVIVMDEHANGDFSRIVNNGLTISKDSGRILENMDFDLINISEEEKGVELPRLKISRPPIYKRLQAS